MTLPRSTRSAVSERGKEGIEVIEVGAKGRECRLDPGGDLCGQLRLDAHAVDVPDDVSKASQGIEESLGRIRENGRESRHPAKG